MSRLYRNLGLPKERIHVKEAGLLRRALAFLIDLLLLDLFILGSFAALFPTKMTEILTMTISGSLYAATVAMTLLALSYFALFEWLLAQTPGMMLLNIRAENVNLTKALVRNLYLLPLFPFPLLLILEPVYLLWRKKRLLEVLSGTRTTERISY